MPPLGLPSCHITEDFLFELHCACLMIIFILLASGKVNRVRVKTLDWACKQVSSLRIQSFYAVSWFGFLKKSH
jgi:hypothetical protein